MECDLIDLAKSIMVGFKEKGLHTDSYFERMNYMSLPLWPKDYCSAICTVTFNEDHINLIISYERKLDPTYPNPRRIFEYCNPAFPNNLYEFVSNRTREVLRSRHQ